MKGEYLSSGKVKYHFYFLQICQIPKFYIKKVDLNVRQEGSKWSKLSNLKLMNLTCMYNMKN